MPPQLRGQEDSPRKGFICPDCKHCAATPEELVVHYEVHLVEKTEAALRAEETNAEVQQAVALGADELREGYTEEVSAGACQHS